ncbi:MAG: hypothetical protein JWQ70_364 [Aeromicrobium sp.]|nr:hypothetical protein [Aeromicrobium sp.]
MRTFNASAPSRVQFLALSALLVAALTLSPSMIQAASAAPPGPCPSDSFCTWSGPNGGGSRHVYSTVGAYVQISGGSIQSAYNNRSKRSYLNEAPNGGERYSCFGAGDYDNQLSSWQLNSEALWLSTYTNCP